jgi:hypothetical protein
MSCNGKPHMALKEHSGSRESKLVMGVWLLHAMQSTCHPPDHLYPVADVMMVLGLQVPMPMPMPMPRGRVKQVAAQRQRHQQRAK